MRGNILGGRVGRVNELRARPIFGTSDRETLFKKEFRKHRAICVQWRCSRAKIYWANHSSSFLLVFHRVSAPQNPDSIGEPPSHRNSEILLFILRIETLATRTTLIEGFQ